LSWNAYIDRLEGTAYLDSVQAGLDWCDLGKRVRRDDRVFIKPNLTFPVFRKGVMTNPECVEALVIALKDYTDRITVGEADSGGYNRFDMDEVMARTGLKDLEKRYGIELVNLSRGPTERRSFYHGRRQIDLDLPTLLLHETALMFSAGVPKIHMNTLVSMTVKNLWGCIPQPPNRLRLHPHLPEVLYEMTQAFPPAMGMIDGRYGLNRSGPMEGDPVELNWLLMGDDLYGLDALCCRLMGIDPSRPYYFRRALRAGARIPTPGEARMNQDYRAFEGPRFYLRRRWTDYPGILCFHSELLSYLGYFSPLADPLHKLLYVFRKPFYDYDDPNRTEHDEQRND